jgi:hypothetical protein
MAHHVHRIAPMGARVLIIGIWYKPVQATVLPDGNYYLPTTDETIPADMATPSPDDRFHHCSYYPKFDEWGGAVWESKPKTRCFFAPMHSS